ncbi:ribonuclease J [Pilibacter termitis]|uniref:Ribonuclease J n=1 Tax=Pilibacter termitis TaxID=263852 RepID=A0A1T4MDV1_9ENTE|nr:ribonuclease J [Pilibacter termitis]SJZ64948.1 ribonuclease J [Pilibacter termitis]
MSKINIIPLAGVRENGKNMYVLEVDENIFVLDAGLKYPENELLGIDVVIPDFTYLVENKERVAGVFLTHGHADAIGALPYFLAEVDVPVFGSELTIELAKLNVENYPETKNFQEFHVVDENTEIDFGTVEISFFKTTHTIPESLGIQVKTEDGSIVYTGDFKFDQGAIPMYATDYARLANIGASGVLALLSDSSNAENPAQVASEREIAEEVAEVIASWEGRIIVASVASNLARIQQVLKAAWRVNRKVVMSGVDLERIVRTAIRLGKIEVPDEKMFITYKEMKQYADNEILILETGRMGEPIKSLQRMANGQHKNISIQEGDLVYIVTTPSIAMETAVAKAEDIVYRAGGIVKMINENLRVSGHANPNDLKLMLNLLKPQFLIPVQGEYRQLLAHVELAQEIGIDEKRTYITRRGDVLSYDKRTNRFIPNSSVPADNVMIDGLGVGDIGNIVLRDRKILSEDGILVAVTTISRREKKIISKPQVTSRGFVYQRTSRDILKESSKIVEEVLEKHLDKSDFEWGMLKQDIRDHLARYLFEQTKRRPVILPVIMEGTPKRK